MSDRAAGLAKLALLLGLTGPILHLWTVAKAFSTEGFLAAAPALLFFGFAQVVWFVKTYRSTGSLLSPFPLSCLAYLGLFLYYQIRKRLVARALATERGASIVTGTRS
jgi:hypothetical protein